MPRLQMKSNNNIRIIKSKRKTCSIQVLADGQVLVRAPLGMPDKAICNLLEQKQSWIAVSKEKMAELQVRRSHLSTLAEEEISRMIHQAREIIPRKVRVYAEHIGVTYGKISIGIQRSRWGSCNSAGDLRFNCLLMALPEDVLDYVIVHELCHRKEMNHSKAFWNEVKKALPNYEESCKWLKLYGGDLISRIPKTD